MAQLLAFEDVEAILGEEEDLENLLSNPISEEHLFGSDHYALYSLGPLSEHLSPIPSIVSSSVTSEQNLDQFGFFPHPSHDLPPFCSKSISVKPNLQSVSIAS